jgi:hypothetical protein
MTSEDRLALESWDTRALPYGFVCADESLLSRPKKEHTTRVRNILTASATPPPQPIGTPISEQDPDGEDSMFVTLAPPFIELPVKLSDVAMYLHECLVMSRKNGKGHFHDHGLNGKGGGEGPAKIKRPNGSTTNLTAQGESTASHVQPTTVRNIPGIKRLAKAVKTFYPEEYAIGSSKANHAAAQAAVDDGTNVKGKIKNVANTNNHGGSGKSGLFSAFRSKSLIAKQAVGGFSAAAGGVTMGGGRDTNAERFELVTPWREVNE